jgi:hypothetical protein
MCLEISRILGGESGSYVLLYSVFITAKKSQDSSGCGKSPLDIIIKLKAVKYRFKTLYFTAFSVS